MRPTLLSDALYHGLLIMGNQVSDIIDPTRKIRDTFPPEAITMYEGKGTDSLAVVRLVKRRPVLACFRVGHDFFRPEKHGDAYRYNPTGIVMRASREI
ncbi:hypothetical protein L484_020597 [Morus notabilis]|uniref:Uncharacterized protein n=1 Tax=Morus notabilis TaxID=981085 RepID=W9SXF7_9ROSA|nr:hypothetical protein L484_020597 [Morus notabilis]